MHDAVMLNFAIKLHRTVAFIKTMVKIMPAVQVHSIWCIFALLTESLDKPAMQHFLVYTFMAL
jgi:hypothetical protein